jgi:hypothetical protein
MQKVSRCTCIRRRTVSPGYVSVCDTKPAPAPAISDHTGFACSPAYIDHM